MLSIQLPNKWQQRPQATTEPRPKPQPKYIQAEKKSKTKKKKDFDGFHSLRCSVYTIHYTLSTIYTQCQQSASHFFVVFFSLSLFVAVVVFDFIDVFCAVVCLPFNNVDISPCLSNNEVSFICYFKRKCANHHDDSVYTFNRRNVWLSEADKNPRTQWNIMNAMDLSVHIWFACDGRCVCSVFGEIKFRLIIIKFAWEKYSKSTLLQTIQVFGGYFSFYPNIVPSRGSCPELMNTLRKF